MALSQSTQLLFLTMVNGTYSGYVRQTASAPFDLSIWGTWDSATVTLWKSHDKGATWHQWHPNSDATDQQTGVAFSVSDDIDIAGRSEPCLWRWVIASGTDESLNMAWGGRYIRGENGSIS